MAELDKLIPNGLYCKGKESLCPFWARTTSGAYCGYLKIESELHDCNNLIWNKVKECSINTDKELFNEQ